MNQTAFLFSFAISALLTTIVANGIFYFAFSRRWSMLRLAGWGVLSLALVISVSVGLTVIMITALK